MANERRDIYATGSAPSKDWFLQFLVNLANKNRFELDMTLTVGGTLISGTLIGVRQYFDEVSAFFANPFDSGKYPDIKETFRQIGEQCSCVSPSEQTETPSYIHLKNVNFATIDGNPIPENAGSWWRGRLSEVQGFTPGRLGES